MNKILYIVSTLKHSGPTNQLFNLIKHLDKSKFEPHLITLSPEPKDSRWQDYEGIGVKLYSLNLSRIQGVIFAKSRLINLIKGIQPSLIHSQGIRADVLSSKISVCTPKVSTIHNYPQIDYLMTYGRYQGRLMLRKHISTFKKLDLCVGVSNAVEKNVNELFSVLNTTAIPNGVETDIFKPIDQNSKIKIRQTLNLPLDSKIWVSSGHLSFRKDPLFLIEQWKAIFQADKNNILLFIGGGALETECREIASESENIIVQGGVTNVVDFLQASDHFISASKAEGLPMAVIEALACGLPSFLSDIAPHAEVVGMNESVGALFKIGNSESFARGLQTMQKQDYSDMRQSALGLIATKLSAEVMSKAYQCKYEELIRKL